MQNSMSLDFIAFKRGVIKEMVTRPEKIVRYKGRTLGAQSTESLFEI